MNNITPIVIIKVVAIIAYVVQTNNLALLSGSFINWSIGFLLILTPFSRILVKKIFYNNLNI